DLPTGITRLRSLKSLRLDLNDICFRTDVDPEVWEVIIEKRSCSCAGSLDNGTLCHASHLDDSICHETCNVTACGHDTDFFTSHWVPPSCSEEGQQRALEQCEFGCKTSFQNIMANTDLDRDYKVTKEEYVSSLGNSSTAHTLWDLITFKYPKTYYMGYIEFNNFINYYYAAYGIVPPTCAACDLGCAQGMEDCTEFSYEHVESWCSSVSLCD
ncbi:hypothetical protein CYMTET_46822, partial [Cymbomonas tetramitiformis]